MMDDMQKQETVMQHTPHRKVRRNRSKAGKRGTGKVLFVGILLAILVIMGYAASVFSAPALTLPESVQVHDRIMAASQDSLTTADFVSGLEDTQIQVSFGADYDAQQLGRQTVTLVFTKGREQCTRTVELYRFHLETEITVKLGEETQVSARDFVQDSNVPAELLTELTEGACGFFTLRMQCGERAYEVMCTVTETVPPTGIGKTLTVEAGGGQLPAPSEFVEDIQDHTPVTVTYKEQPQFIRVGKQSVWLILTDLFGNTSEVEATANVVPSENGPQFTGLTTIYLEVGGTVSYKTGVTATDAQDGKLSFTVDTGNFDNQTAGEYTVWYSATDSDGNQLIVPRTIIVERKVEQNVYQKAQKILDEIIKPGMTRDEQIYAVWSRVAWYVSYSGNSDKSSVENAAYEGFTHWTGDCYTYYSMIRIMLDMLEIPNLEVTRVGGTSRHWWNLVEFGDGKYYHVDGSAHVILVDNIWREKMTDADLVTYTNNERVAKRRPNFYVYDHSLPQYQGISIA